MPAKISRNKKAWVIDLGDVMAKIYPETAESDPAILLLQASRGMSSPPKEMFLEGRDNLDALHLVLSKVLGK